MWNAPALTRTPEHTCSWQIRRSSWTASSRGTWARSSSGATTSSTCVALTLEKTKTVTRPWLLLKVFGGPWLGPRTTAHFPSPWRDLRPWNAPLWRPPEQTTKQCRGQCPIPAAHNVSDIDLAAMHIYVDHWQCTERAAAIAKIVPSTANWTLAWLAVSFNRRPTHAWRSLFLHKAHSGGTCCVCSHREQTIVDAHTRELKPLAATQVPPVPMRYKYSSTPAWWAMRARVQLAVPDRWQLGRPKVHHMATAVRAAPPGLLHPCAARST